ncbi:unnamed protein product [Peronospora belbahrii]|uniref:RxLR effector protein n=1 Tax=Peronospora belbahrii TaxID=622444 RepID=A0ABN8DBX0_9STRA|nr:unnamed protein product [Peronospora belbahrii]
MTISVLPNSQRIYWIVVLSAVPLLGCASAATTDINYKTALSDSNGTRLRMETEDLSPTLIQHNSEARMFNFGSLTKGATATTEHSLEEEVATLSRKRAFLIDLNEVPLSDFDHSKVPPPSNINLNEMPPSDINLNEMPPSDINLNKMDINLNEMPPSDINLNEMPPSDVKASTSNLFPSNIVAKGKTSSLAPLETTDGVALMKKRKILSDDEVNLEKLFERNELSKDVDNYFDSHRFQSWFNTALEIYNGDVKEAADAIIVILTRHFKDEALRMKLQNPTTTDEAKKIVFALDAAQISYWVKIKATSNNVFVWLRLNRGDVNVLLNPELQSWKAFFIARGLDQKLCFESLFKLLLNSGYRKVDILAMAKQVAENKDIAFDDIYQFTYVLLKDVMDNTSAKERAFTYLELKIETCFQSPLLSVWYNYMNEIGLKPVDMLLKKLRYIRQNLEDIADVREENMYIVRALKEKVQLQNQELAEAQIRSTIDLNN